MGFPKLRGTIFGIPIINKDYSILGSILGSPYFGNYHIGEVIGGPPDLLRFEIRVSPLIAPNVVPSIIRHVTPLNVRSLDIAHVAPRHPVGYLGLVIAPNNQQPGTQRKQTQHDSHGAGHL